MPLEALQTTRKKTVGTKQTMKAVQKGLVQEVFVAKDADKRLVALLTNLCREKNIPVTLVPTMKELGKACGIQVGAASAAMLK